MVTLSNNGLRTIRLGIKSLLLHKLRSFLTILGLLFGVASVISMLAVGEGANYEALEQIKALGPTNKTSKSSKNAKYTNKSKIADKKHQTSSNISYRKI